MELSWTTFVLEVINFLVLVWILKRFLYRPVLSALQRRQQSVQQTLEQAASRQRQAESLEQQYQGRLEQWDQEKQQAWQALQDELQAERNRRLKQLQAELADEREKAAVIEQRQQAEMQAQYQQQAHQQATRFAAKLLRHLSGPELNDRLFHLFIEQIRSMQDDRRKLLRDACQHSANRVRVISAGQIKKDQRNVLQQALQDLCAGALEVDYEQDPELIAGLRINLGEHILCLDLQQELNGFAEIGNEPG